MTAEVDDDAEARRLMAEGGFGTVDEPFDDAEDMPDDTPLDYDEEMEQYRRDVTPDDQCLDQIILGCSDVDRAIEDFEQMTGVRPIFAVSLRGVGTKSARIAFKNGCCFLEIIGPDPKQEFDTELVNRLKGIPLGKMEPLHYAVRDEGKIEKKVWKDHEMTSDNVTMVAKDRGDVWKWSMYLMEGHDMGGLVPFICTWGDNHHVAGRLPLVGNLDSVTVRSNEGDPIKAILDGVEGVDFEEGSNELIFTFSSDKGQHTFSCPDPAGIAFPK